MLCTKERLFRWSSDGLCAVERRAVHHHIERGVGARKQEHLGYDSFGFFPLWGWRAQKKKKKFVLLFFSSSEYRSQVWNIKLIFFPQMLSDLMSVSTTSGFCFRFPASAYFWIFIFIIHYCTFLFSQLPHESLYSKFMQFTGVIFAESTTEMADLKNPH